MSQTWPTNGCHILATFDDSNIIIYQAYCPELGDYAVEHQKFGGNFSFSRMSWIKPNFLWMMYRSGWGTKSNQEVVLAITIPRLLFEEILEHAVPTPYWKHLYTKNQDWRSDLKKSEVLLQWDPDHHPDGTNEERRAIQLGLRGEMLQRYAQTEVVSVEDISGFVAEQRKYVEVNEFDKIMVPAERLYVPKSTLAAQAVGLDSI